jgi:hypothetical protein
MRPIRLLARCRRVSAFFVSFAVFSHQARVKPPTVVSSTGDMDMVSSTIRLRIIALALRGAGRHKRGM